MIQRSMKEIQQMFFDLALLVDEQGEHLDYVQVNVAF
jgi:t-SNARE complex subunit (syntaxin)